MKDYFERYPPQEVLDAADLLDKWFKKNSLYPDGKWELMGVCSRNHAWELENYKTAVDIFLKRRPMGYMVPADFYQSMLQIHLMFEELLKTANLNIPEDIYSAYAKMIKSKNQGEIDDVIC